MEWLFAGIAALVGTTIGALVNYNSSKDTNNTAVDMMKQQNEFNATQTAAQNKWNSYPNQVAQIRRAGLNPAFLFNNGVGQGTGSAATAAGIPSLTPPHFDSNSIARQMFDSVKLKNETMKTEAETDNLTKQSATLEKALSQADERFKVEMDNIKSRSDLNDADRQKALQQIETEKAHYVQLLSSAENLNYQADLYQMMTYTEGWNAAKASAEYDRLLTITPLEANVLKSQYHLNESQADLTVETINKVKKETVNLLKQGKQIDALTYSQILDNTVKELETENKAVVEDLKRENDWMNLIYTECDGWIGSAAKALAVISQGFSATFGYGQRHANYRQRAKHNPKPTTNYLFGVE